LADVSSGITNDRSTATALNITPSRGVNVKEKLGDFWIFILLRNLIV